MFSASPAIIQHLCHFCSGSGIGRGEHSDVTTNSAGFDQQLHGLIRPEKESFIANMEYEGYEVRWIDTHKHILFTTPEEQQVDERQVFELLTFIYDILMINIFRLLFKPTILNHNIHSVF